MTYDSNSKCPYCGSGLLSEEDGYRCRLCKSFFPYDAEEGIAENAAGSLSKMEPQIVNAEDARENREQADKSRRYQMAAHELITLAPAFISVGFMMFGKMREMPLLLIPGFVLWVFAAGFLAFQYYRAKKNDTTKPAMLRTVFMLVVSILVAIFVRPGN